jgi:hypothetical protein
VLVAIAKTITIREEVAMMTGGLTHKMAEDHSKEEIAAI